MSIAELECGDCRDVLLELAATGQVFDSVVCDPPYHLTSTVERFGKPGSAPAKSDGATGVYARASRGFMGKEWDGGDVAFRPETWRLVMDVMKPGAHLLAFGGTRTFHRMAVAIEDAGFELRDCVMWLYGTGFPKSHDVSKGIDREAGAEREVVGIDEKKAERFRRGLQSQNSGWDRPWMHAEDAVERKAGITAPATPEAARWQGWGTALKPAYEPVIVARKPLVGTVAANVLQFGTGALNIDASRIPHSGAGGLAESLSKNPGRADLVSSGVYGPGRPQQHVNTEGRWPANVIHDGSDEVEAAFAAFGERAAGRFPGAQNQHDASSFSVAAGRIAPERTLDSGSASRFFYSAKASKADRAGSKHPTVKPIALMRYLVRMVTPPGGRVLDPFAGSGTTLQAAVECGFSALGIERDPEYQADIRRRIAALQDEMEALCA